MHTVNPVKAAKASSVHYHTVLRAINAGTLPATYDGYEYRINVLDVARFANDRRKRFNPDATIKRQLRSGKAGEAESTFRASYPGASWSVFAAKFGGSSEQARSRFRRYSDSSNKTQLVV